MKSKIIMILVIAILAISVVGGYYVITNDNDEVISTERENKENNESIGGVDYSKFEENIQEELYAMMEIDNSLNCQGKTYYSVLEKYPDNYDEIFAKYYQEYATIGDSAAWDVVESDYPQYENFRYGEDVEYLDDCEDGITIKVARLRVNYEAEDPDWDSKGIDYAVDYQAKNATGVNGNLLSEDDNYFKVTGMLLMNGNNMSKEEWKENARAKKIKITINNDAEHVVELKDTMDVQLIDVEYLQNNIETPITLDIEVLETYPGEVSNDVYIADIRVGLDSSIGGGI